MKQGNQPHHYVYTPPFKDILPGERSGAPPSRRLTPTRPQGAHRAFLRLMLVRVRDAASAVHEMQLQPFRLKDRQHQAGLDRPVRGELTPGPDTCFARVKCRLV